MRGYPIADIIFCKDRTGWASRNSIVQRRHACFQNQILKSFCLLRWNAREMLSLAGAQPLLKLIQEQNGNFYLETMSAMSLETGNCNLGNMIQLLWPHWVTQHGFTKDTWQKEKNFLWTNWHKAITRNV